MFKIITMLSLFLLGLIAQAQITEARAVSPFQKILVTDGVEVVLTQNSTQTVAVEAPDALSGANVLTVVENNTLKISSHGNQGEIIKVYVTANALLEIKAKRKSKITMTNMLEADKIVLEISSGATFNGSVSATNLAVFAKSSAVCNIRVDTKQLNVELKGGSKANLSGNATKTKISTDSNAFCFARNLKSDKAFVNAGDDSSIMINANSYLNVNLIGTGKVTYFGTPISIWMQEDATALTSKD